MTNLSRYTTALSSAFEAILANKMRSMLTALGIIFGVAAVISMLAIGNGARQEILDQMKLVGVNNIVVKPVIEQEEENVTDDNNKKDERKFSPGLTLKDVESIKSVLPGIERVSPEIVVETGIIKNGIRRTAKIVGVEPDYFSLASFELDKGEMFNKHHLLYGDQVCIIGYGIKTKFFSKEDPIGKYIKCGPIWLKVVGVLKERQISEGSISKLGIRDYNMDVYAPLQTILIRYKNRALITQKMLQGGGTFHMGGSTVSTSSSGQAPKNYHQLDRLVIQMENTEQLGASSEVISRLLERRHYGVVDYEVSVPELLLKQQQKTKNIFNFVLGAIAGISLLVGGIGIMNIMLASVLERLREIGVRLAVGATKGDIILQFLSESILISLTGGLIGVILGVLLSYMVTSIAEIKTIVTPFSIILSFGVAASVGLIFGITPAKRAAEQDPIRSLRYE